MEISRTGVAEAAVGISVLTLQDKTGGKIALHPRYSVIPNEDFFQPKPGAPGLDFETWEYHAPLQSQIRVSLRETPTFHKNN